MKKNMKKIITFFISGVIILLNCTYAFADEIKINSTSSIITLDKVIDAAIKNSDSLELKEKDIQYYKDKIRFQKDANNFYEDINDDDIDQQLLDFKYDQLKVLKEQSEESKRFAEDQIASKITDMYNNIVIKQIELDNLNKSLEIKNKDLYYLRVKTEIGKYKLNDLEDKELEIKSLQDTILSKENLINVNKEYLSVLTGLDLCNYEFNKDINYSRININSTIDEFLDDKIEEYLHYNKEILEITEDCFKDVEDDDIDDILQEDTPIAPSTSNYINKTENEDGTITTSMNYGSYAVALMKYKSEIETYVKHLNRYESYLDVLHNVQEGKTKLEEARKSLKNGLKETYVAIINLENTIDNLKVTIKSTNKKLEFAKVSVENGMMTKNGYEYKLLNAKQLDVNLRSLINTHNSLKNNIQKTWKLINN
ncbi:multidrug transporter [Clostridium botulinum]|nr:multidrug transporter [Clostridium botulinum]